ncbi:MAG TPA: hypothetical protein VLJ79_23650 [Candidatus Binatia bacterium]|nr:hypothetical protein [Candidatus Binatia bacterium]
MKVEIPFLAGLLLVGTNLFARVAVQGVEQALFSTAIEYGWNVIKSSKGFLHETVRRPCFLGR